jgi:hypothetical protein
MVVLYFTSCTNHVDILDKREAILGKFIQIQDFNQVNPNPQFPEVLDWVNVDNGFTLELIREGQFIWSKYPCQTGSYACNRFDNEITFVFDCAVVINGDSFTRITEELEVNSNLGFMFIQSCNNEDCTAGCWSSMKRI